MDVEQETLRVVTIYDDLVSLSFILKVPVLSEAYLEPSRTSMMKLFVKIAESH